MQEDMENRAVFIAGCPRSGTTLMTALLDAHSDLLVFPEEYLYVKPRKTPPCAGVQGLVRCVLKEKIVLRLQGKESFFDEILDDHREYEGLDFGCFEKAVDDYFTRLGEKNDDGAGMSMEARVLSSLINGYGFATGKRNYSRWVVKSPLYELHWQKLFTDFPEARLLYLVRDPRDVLLSRTIKRNRKRYLKRGGSAAIWKSENGSPMPAVRFLKEWERSVTESVRVAENFPGRILQVRYEDLASAPREEMERVAAFLGVPWQESLITPSFHGSRWNGNSMQGRTFQGVGYSNGLETKGFGPHQRWQIEAWLGDVMVKPPARYVPSALLERIDYRALLTWLPGEGGMDYCRNRFRMLSNQRMWPQQMRRKTVGEGLDQTGEGSSAVPER
jgi:hypothetical protein